MNADGQRFYQLTNLTNTSNDWDKHAHYSPDGKKVAWMSSTSLNVDLSRVKVSNFEDHLATELWIMDVDGWSRSKVPS